MRPPVRSGFTLIELLVVIVIIGILAALIVPAIAGAVVKAKEAAVLAEVNNLAISLEAFKSKNGFYPPSRVVLSETGDYSAATLGPAAPLANRSMSALRAMAPRLRLSLSGPTGAFYDFNGDGLVSPVVVLQGDECLVFFLGGIPKPVGTGWAVTGFCADPTNPFQAGGNHSAPFYTFDNSRLIDIDGDGFPSYVDSFGGPNSPTPLAYFSAYDGVGYDPDDVNYGEPGGTYPIALGAFQASNAIAAFTGGGMVPKRPDLIASPAPNPYTFGPSAPSVATDTRQTVWHRPQSFQIIFAGRDRLFGIGGNYDPKAGTMLPFDPTPELLVTGQTFDGSVRIPEVDNGANFTGGRLGP